MTFFLENDAMEIFQLLLIVIFCRSRSWVTIFVVDRGPISVQPMAEKKSRVKWRGFFSADIWQFSPAIFCINFLLKWTINIKKLLFMTIAVKITLRKSIMCNLLSLNRSSTQQKCLSSSSLVNAAYVSSSVTFTQYLLSIIQFNYQKWPWLVPK